MGGLVARFLGLPSWARILGPIAGAVALMAVGAFAWDRTPVIGPHARILGLQGQLTAETRKLWDMTGQRDYWRGGKLACEDTRLNERNTRAGAVTDTETKAGAHAGDAFDQGFAAGRVIGRRSCGATNATPSDPGGLPVPGGVRDDPGADLADLWNGAGR